MKNTQQDQLIQIEKQPPSINLEQMEENVTINPSTVPYSSAPPQQIKSDSIPEDKLNKDKHKKIQPRKNQKAVEDNPEYYRVDFQICHKLYQIYRRLKIGSSQQSQGLSFDQREQGSTTLNYHKILQMFKDMKVRLQISQKLSILRAIKKFSFNQNFISQDEFSKIFKVIVHGVGIKQTLFKPLIREKYASVAQKQPANMQRRAISIRLNKNFAAKLKTEPAVQKFRIKTNVNEGLLSESKTIHTIKPDVHTTYLKHNQTIDKETTYIEQSRASARKTESRKKIITEASRYEPAQKGYLNRAMEKNKLHKVTWDSLFKMNSLNMHPSISIPHFVSTDTKLDELYF